jgi:predicted N-formylglutamate amidohydrolase
MDDIAPELVFHDSPLLGPGDPPVCEIANHEGTAALLLICDHASRAVPVALDGLGVDEAHWRQHVAWDIGASDVARGLSRRLNAVAVLAGYSRLVIDLNRQPGDPESIPKVSDDVQIPGNQGLGEAAETERVDTFFWPYHLAVNNTLAHLWRRGRPPLLLSIHSFTPSLKGEDRYWHIGVLWNRDPRLAKPLIDELRAHDYLHVGDNEPYSGVDLAYTIERHAGAAGLPNCAVEIRQDLLEDATGVESWVNILADAMENILAREDIFRVEHF